MTLMVSRNIAINNSSLFFHTLDLCSIRSTLNFRSTHYIRIYHIRIYHLRISYTNLIIAILFAVQYLTLHATCLCYTFASTVFVPLVSCASAALTLFSYSAIPLYSPRILCYSSTLLRSHCRPIFQLLTFYSLCTLHTIQLIMWPYSSFVLVFHFTHFAYSPSFFTNFSSRF